MALIAKAYEGYAQSFYVEAPVKKVLIKNVQVLQRKKLTSW